MVSGGATSRIGTGKALSIMKIAQFVNVFLFALVAGIFWGTWFSLSRSISSITRRRSWGSDGP
ncbi:MAG: hypothetical protein DMF54_13225 [Acidobacteria bacterium]|nr:MAG: hypothetical protein DMF54_13225 [Acidobacteriota bacterium]